MVDRYSRLTAVILLLVMWPLTGAAQTEGHSERGEKTLRLHDKSQAAVRMRYAFSCYAYASIQASKYYRITVDVYKDGKEPASPEQAKEARKGLVWMNRGFIARREAGLMWKKIYNSVPTNGDLDQGKQLWVDMLQDTTQKAQRDILSNCILIYGHADRYCETNECMPLHPKHK